MVQKLALGAGAEALTWGLLGKGATSVIAGVAGIGTAPAFLGACVAWAVLAPAVPRVARAVGPRLLELGSNGMIDSARLLGKGAASALSGLKVMTLMFSGANGEVGRPRGPRRLIHSENTDAIKKVAAEAAAGRPSAVDVIFTEQGYQEFASAMRKRGIPVIELDADAAQQARDAKKPFDNGLEAFGEITRLIDANKRITPDEANNLIDRLAKSHTLHPETRKDLFKYLGDELTVFARETADERELLDSSRKKVDDTVQELDKRALERIRQNEDVARAIDEAGYLTHVEDYLQAIRNSVHSEGPEKTLERIKLDPAAFGELDRVRGYFESPEKAHEIDNRRLREDPYFQEKLATYVTNLVDISTDAQEVRRLRERQMELDLRVAEREESISRVQKRIERETLLIDPDVSRQILRNSLEEILKAREPDLKKVEKEVVAEAKQDVAEVKQGDREKVSAQIVDLKEYIGRFADMAGRSSAASSVDSPIDRLGGQVANFQAFTSMKATTDATLLSASQLFPGQMPEHDKVFTTFEAAKKMASAEKTPEADLNGRDGVVGGVQKRASGRGRDDGLGM